MTRSKGGKKTECTYSAANLHVVFALCDSLFQARYGLKNGEEE